MSQTQVERLFIADKTSTTGNMWRVTSSATLAAGSSDLTSNWETIDSYSAGVAGSSMSQSSGIFTFPSTGIYYVKGQMMVSRTSAAIDYTGMRIYGTADNSSYADITFLEITGDLDPLPDTGTFSTSIDQLSIYYEQGVKVDLYS